MNATRFDDSADRNRSSYVTGSHQQQDDPLVDWSTIMALRDVIWYSAVALGVPGNVLSAIVWLRHQAAVGRASAVYLGALAVVNLVYLLTRFLCLYVVGLHSHVDGWAWIGANYIAGSAGILAPLLLLSFSVQRLISVLRPLRVRTCCLRCAQDQNVFTTYCFTLWHNVVEVVGEITGDNFLMIS